LVLASCRQILKLVLHKTDSLYNGSRQREARGHGILAVMLSDKDIDKLLKVFPTRAEVEHIVEKKLEEGLAPIKHITQQTLLAVEGLASRHDKQELVNASRDTQQSRHDRWIHQIADESKVQLKD